MLDIIDLLNEEFEVRINEIDRENLKDVFDVLAEEKFRLEFRNKVGDHDFVMSCSESQLNILRNNVNKIYNEIITQYLDSRKKG